MTVHLYLATPDVLGDPLRAAACRALLTDDERARVDRYLRPEDQHLSLLARALLRRALSTHHPIDAARWRFVANRYGRPEIDPSLAVGPVSHLRFNLSHTRGMVALVIAHGREVGVDVEDTARRGQTLEIADRFFAPSEVRALRALAPEAQRRRFFDHWTLKESYIKARGMGLAIPLHQFAFALESGQISLRCDPELGDHGDRWTFAQRTPSDRHLVALAATAARETPVRWVEHDGHALLP